MAQLAKCLPRKHEGLSWVPRTQVKSQTQQCKAISPVLPAREYRVTAAC